MLPVMPMNPMRQMLPWTKLKHLWTRVDSAIDGLKSGACDYLMKPADIDEILEKAMAAFEKRQRLEEKIRIAQSKKYMRSPREILKDNDE